MSATTVSSSAPHPDKGKPWWRYPFVWMVFGGPAAVVVACMYTVHLALVHVDPVLDTSADKVSKPSEAPALQGRNRAAQTSAEVAKQGAQEPADR